MLDKLTKSYYENKDFMYLLKHSRPISEADPSKYDCIYFTGGHGVMFDYPKNPYIERAINEIYDKGGIVAAVCHGVAALLHVKTINRTYFIDQKSITGFSNTEELLSKRKKYVPFMLEDEVKNQGAHYSKATLPFRPYIQIDDRLITGQNPQSPKQVAQAVLNMWK